MYILITGGAGFIGSNLANKLVARGYIVTVLDNLSPQIHGANPWQTSPLLQQLPKHIKVVQESVTSRQILEKLLLEERCDAIIHLAAETGTGQSMYSIEKYCEVNVQGTALMLDILTNNKHTVRKMIVASSRAIYGEGKYISDKYGIVYPGSRSAGDMQASRFDPTFGDDPKLTVQATSEDSKIHPSSVYGITKQVQEQLVMTACAAIGVAPVALRYQNVFGPGQSLSNPYTGILSIFSNRILSGQPINIFEDGKESRDFVFIDDVVRATVLALESEKANGKVYNVGTGVATTVEEVVSLLMDAYGRKVDCKITGEFRLGDIRHNFADMQQITADLGFQPQVSFEEGLALFCKWVRSQDLPADKYEESLKELKSRGLFGSSTTTSQIK
jgi:dTDP-L-rhamnose 4-epimerase